MQIPVIHVVVRWAQTQGWRWAGPLDRQSRGHWDGSTTGHEIISFIDPLTAIGLGLVTPEELGYPEGILAAFNLLKGN